MDPVILASARKHGVADKDMIHVHPVRVLLLDDLTMLLGADLSARMLEVGVINREGIDFIVTPCAPGPSFFR